jgi:DNA-binding HxlR family transcriptional regulator
MSSSPPNGSRRLDPAYLEHVSRFINLVKGKWTIQILCAMHDHPVRLSELKRIIPSASKKALVANLRILEDQRLVLRRDLSESVLHVEYEFMETMRVPMMAVLDRVVEWSEIYESQAMVERASQE